MRRVQLAAQASLPTGSENQLQSKPHLPFPNRRTDDRIAVQSLHRTIRIERSRRDRRPGIRELRRVRQTERFGAELQIDSLSYLERPKHAGIQIEDARSAQDVPAACAETYRRH